MKIQELQKAPDFELKDQNGNKHKLSDYKGSWVLLYFYPKDNTPGCTVEACKIRDNWGKYETKGIKVLGVSADSEKSHKKFAEKNNLQFSILSDESREVINLYGVQKEKKLFGKTVMGIARTSFLINPKGVVSKIFENVNPAIHAEEVLKNVE